MNLSDGTWNTKSRKVKSDVEIKQKKVNSDNKISRI